VTLVTPAEAVKNDMLLAVDAGNIDIRLFPVAAKAGQVSASSCLRGLPAPISNGPTPPRPRALPPARELDAFEHEFAHSSRWNPAGSRGGLSSFETLHDGHGMPGSPQPHAPSPSHGRSSCASHTPTGVTAAGAFHRRAALSRRIGHDGDKGADAEGKSEHYRPAQRPEQ
jgi:hypothetical protein